MTKIAIYKILESSCNCYFSDLYEDYGFKNRLTKLETEFPDANTIAMKLSHGGMKKVFFSYLINQLNMNK